MEITREELRKLYETRTVQQLRNKLGGIGPNQLYKLLDEAGIPRKGSRKHSVKLVD